MSGPWPKCENGTYLYISHDNTAKYSEPWVKAGEPNETIEVAPEELCNLLQNPVVNARYIASCYAAKSKELRITQGRIDAKKFGMMAIAVSGVLSHKMEEARNVLRDRVGSQLGASYVALNIRCGESLFEAHSGEVVLGSKNIGFQDGFQSKIPDELLKLLRKLPRGLSCRRALFLTTDSERFRKEVEIAMPNGIRVISCCSSPVHVGFGPANRSPVTSQEGLQHLVDVVAMSESAYIFKGDGGFAELGPLASS